MPVRWDENSTCALLIALLSVTQEGNLDQNQKNAVVKQMADKGFDTNWNAIRLVSQTHLKKLVSVVEKALLPSFLVGSSCTTFLIGT